MDSERTRETMYETSPGPDDSVSISCDDCALDGTGACDDCVVSILLGTRTQGAVIVDVMEARAMRMLQQEGLVPGLRFRRRVG